MRLPDGRAVTQAVIRDVTARVEAERRQRTLELELEDARRLEGLGRLAGGLAHDLRNMLTPILLNTHELRETPDLAASAQAMIEEIEEAGKRAGELLSQILTFARRQPLKVVVVDVNGEIEGLEPMLRRIIRSDIDLAFELDGKLRPVRADKGQLGQVLVNLVANARDAMPTGGHLTVETRNVTISEDYAVEHPGLEPGAYTCIIVSDTGEGMSEQVRQHIFDPFFTTKGATEGVGVGLGLATVHGIVTQSGGTIHVYSEPGHGASFRIYLPSVEEEPRQVLPDGGSEAQALEAGRLFQVLLVDDEELVRRPLVRALRRAGLNVIEAATGDEAVSIAGQFAGKIDLLITDVVMPRMSGPALAAELAKTRPEMEVLFLSGYTDVGMVRSGALGEGARVLSKPFIAKELLEKVKTILMGSFQKR
jgi:signal transduction histidine kinase